MPESLEQQHARFHATHTPVARRLGAHDWRWWRGGAGDVPVLWLTGIVGLGEFAFAPLLALGPRFRVVAPDYPPARRLDDLVDGLAALLDAEGIDAAHVVGGSFGGMMAQQLVRRHPSRVRSLVLSHTAAPSPSRQRALATRVATWLPGGALRALFARRLRPSFAGADPFWGRWFDEALGRLTRDDIASRLRLAAEFLDAPAAPAAWRGPVLLVEADDDPLMPDATRAGMRRAFPGAATHTFTGTGHAAAILDPAGYARVIAARVLAAHEGRA